MSSFSRWLSFTLLLCLLGQSVFIAPPIHAAPSDSNIIKQTAPNSQQPLLLGNRLVVMIGILQAQLSAELPIPNLIGPQPAALLSTNHSSETDRLLTIQPPIQQRASLQTTQSGTGIEGDPIVISTPVQPTDGQTYYYSGDDPRIPPNSCLRVEGTSHPSDTFIWDDYYPVGPSIFYAKEVYIRGGGDFYLGGILWNFDDPYDVTVGTYYGTSRFLAGEDVNITIDPSRDGNCDFIPNQRLEDPGGCTTGSNVPQPPTATADPISLGDGSWYLDIPCFTLGDGGAGLPIRVGFHYNTRLWHDGYGINTLGEGWTRGYARSLRYRPTYGTCIPNTATSGSCTPSIIPRYALYTETPANVGGDYAYWFTSSSSNPSTFTGVGLNSGQLVQDSTTGNFTLTYPSGMRDIFDAQGQLIRQEDRLGNATIIQWNSDQSIKTLINNRTNQKVELVFTTIAGQKRLITVRDASTNGSTPRIATLTYDSQGRVKTITDPGQRVHTFGYDSAGRINTYYDPVNDPALVGSAAKAVTNTYDSAIPYRVARQVARNGATLDLAWTGINDTTAYLDLTINVGQNTQRGQRYVVNTTKQRVETTYIPNSTSTVDTQYTFDGADRLVEEYRPGRSKVTYGYDNGHRVSEIREYQGYAYDATIFQYNAFGQPTQITHPDGGEERFAYHTTTGVLLGYGQWGSVSGQTTAYTTTFQYNTAGQVTKSILPDGTVNTQTYDSRGYPMVTTYDSGTGRLNLTEKYTYNWRGDLQASINLQGIRTTYAYTQNAAAGYFGGLGWPYAVVVDKPTSGTGRAVRTTMRYDRVGNLTELIEDAGSGRTNAKWRYRYEPIGLDGAYGMVEQITPLNHTIRQTYQSTGELASIIEVGALPNAGNRTTSFGYTPQGWLERTTLHDGRVAEARTYTNYGQLASVTDARGSQTQYTYDYYKGLLKDIKTGTVGLDGLYPNADTVNYTYDNRNRVIKVASGNIIHQQQGYDQFGNVAWERDGAGVLTSYRYDNRQRIIQQIRGEGTQTITTNFSYDRAGRITQQVVDPHSLALTTQYLYTDSQTSDRWNLQRMIDPRNHTTTYRYNSLGLQSQVTDALGNRWSYEHTNLGYLQTVTPPIGASTSYTTDLLGRITQLSRNGQTEQWAYNIDGTLASYRDFAGQMTQYTYDQTSRLTSIDRLGTNADAQFTYLPNDLVATATSKPNGTSAETTTYGYDPSNRLLKRTRSNRTTTYYYTSYHTVAAIEYWNRGRVNYASSYPYPHKLSYITPWNLHNTIYSYQATGNLDKIARYAGGDTTYTYDGAGRLTQSTALKSSGTPIQNLQFTYDQASNVTNLTDQWGTTTYQYDALNRLTQSTLPAIAGGPDTSTINYMYDEGGNRLTPLPESSLTTENRVTNGTFESGFSPWENWGNSTTVANVNGSTALRVGPNTGGAGQAVAVQPNTTYTLKGWGRMSTAGSIGYLGVKGEDTNGQPFEYVIKFTESTGKTQDITFTTPNSVAFMYVYAWKNSTDGAGTFDVDNVVLGATIRYDASDRITSQGFQYDANGNLLKEPDGTTYTYDSANRLIKTVKPGNTTVYQYDAFGNLVRQIHNGVTTDFVLDESQTHVRVLGVITGATETLYAYGPEGLHAQQTWVNGAVQEARFAHLDHQGSIRTWTDYSGNVLEQHTYDPWGNLRFSSGTLPIGTMHGYTGEQTHPDGTVHLRARTYAPHLGRFLQRDSFAGFAHRPQSLNRYAYVEGNPVNLVDPSGMTPSSTPSTNTVPQPSTSLSLPYQYIVWDIIKGIGIGLGGIAGAVAGKQLLEKPFEAFFSPIGDRLAKPFGNLSKKLTRDCYDPNEDPLVKAIQEDERQAIQDHLRGMERRNPSLRNAEDHQTEARAMLAQANRYGQQAKNWERAANGARLVRNGSAVAAIAVGAAIAAPAIIGGGSTATVGASTAAPTVANNIVPFIRAAVPVVIP